MGTACLSLTAAVTDAHEFLGAIGVADDDRLDLRFRPSSLGARRAHAGRFRSSHGAQVGPHIEVVAEVYRARRVPDRISENRLNSYEIGEIAKPFASRSLRREVGILGEGPSGVKGPAGPDPRLVAAG